METYNDNPENAFFKTIQVEADKIKANPVGAALQGARLATLVGQPKTLVNSLSRRGLHDTLVATDLFQEKKAGVEISVFDPLKVYQLLNDNFDVRWFDWEPETLWTELSRVSNKTLELTPEFKNLVLMLQVLVNTDFIHEEWHVFENAIHALNGNVVNFSVLQPCELDEVAQGLKIIKTIRPKEEFDSEIYGYIASVAKSSGVVYLPPDLFGEEAQKSLDSIGNNEELKALVKDRWPSPPKNEDSIEVKVQLLRLNEIVENA